MARLRLKDANERQCDNCCRTAIAIVRRENAARVIIGAGDIKKHFDDLLAQALNDSDFRVSRECDKSVGESEGRRSSKPLLTRGIMLLSRAKSNASQSPE